MLAFPLACAVKSFYGRN